MHPNCTKHTKTTVYGEMGWIGCVRCEKFRRDIVAQTFCTTSARFAPSFIRQPNGPECTQIVRSASKCQFTVQWGGSDEFVAKNSDTTSWHKLLHYIGQFGTKFRMATKRSRMHTNSMKCTKMSVWVQWGGSGALVAKNYNVTSWHEVLH